MSRALFYFHVGDAEDFAERLVQARRGRQSAIDFARAVLAHLTEEGDE